MFRSYLGRRLFRRPATGESTILFIVTFPRSGSTALGSFFESIGEPFYYYGEIFGFNQWPKTIDRITANYPFFSSRYLKRFLQKKKEGTIPYKFEISGLDPEKVLRSLQKSPGIHIFKIMNYHFPPERLEELIEEFRPKVLFLRRNHLDRYISNKKAQATGKWHGFNTDDEVIEVDEKNFANAVETSTNFYSCIRRSCLSSNVDWLDLDYSEAFTQSSLQELLKLAGTQFSRDDLNALITTKKQDSKHLSREAFLCSLHAKGSYKSIGDYDFRKQNG